MRQLCTFLEQLDYSTAPDVCSIPGDFSKAAGSISGFRKIYSGIKRIGLGTPN